MKKIKIFILSFLLILCLSSCVTPKKDYLDEITNALENFSIDELNTPLTNNILLEKSYNYNNIAYEVNYSTDSQYLNPKIGNNKILLSVLRPDLKDTRENITVSLSQGIYTISKNIEVTILKSDFNGNLDNAISNLEINNGSNQIRDDVKLTKYIDYANTRFQIKYECNSPYIDFFYHEDYTLLKLTRPKNKNLNIKIIATISNSYATASKEFTLTIMNEEDPIPAIDEFGIYDTKDEVSLFIVTYKKLPKNYYKKNDFYDINGKWNINNKISCGGDTFKNREGLLPKNDHYIECDIEYRGGGRNAKRLVFSIETLNIYYTSDHYQSFIQIYRNGKRV